VHADDPHDVVRRELELLDPAIRRNPEAVRERLHPEFREVGASGRVWDRGSMIVSLASEEDDTPSETREMEPVALAEGVVLLTYTVRRGDRESYRASIWELHEGAWRLRYHQGTPIP
jgi:hypothetical protein